MLISEKLSTIKSEKIGKSIPLVNVESSTKVKKDKKKKDKKKEDVPVNSIESMDKEFKKDGVMCAVLPTKADVRHWYKTDIAPLDCILGGGVPAGRLIEVYGNESSGKTTIGLLFALAFQKYWDNKGVKNKVLWIESESTLDRMRAMFMGVNLDNMMMYESQCIEDIAERKKKVITKLSESGVKVLCVWDTLATAKPKNELEGNEYNSGMQYKPRLISKIIGNNIELFSKTDTTEILLNQAYRGDHGVLIAKGGQGPKYFSSIRLLVKRASDLVEVLPNGEESVVGINMSVHTRKNKLFYPRQTAIIPLKGDKGPDALRSVSKFLFDKKVIKVAGSWKSLTFKGKEYKFQSDKKLKKLIEEVEPLLWDYLNYLVYKHYSDASPLMKVNLLEKTWEYEKIVFGKRVTVLTDIEKKMAKLLEEQVERDLGIE